MNETLKLPAVQRPNGKMYRPRSIKATMIGNEDEVSGVVVFGTHDIRFADMHAHALAESHKTTYGIGLVITGSGKPDWYGTQIVGSDDDGHMVTVFTTDTNKGRACVVFPAEEIEATR